MAVKTYAQILLDLNNITTLYTTHTEQIDATIASGIDITDTVQSVVGGVGSRIDNLAIASVGLGESLYSTRVGDSFKLKSLKAGTNVSLSSNANEITINVAGTGEANTASNVGTGAIVYKQKTGVNFEFKTVLATGRASVSVTANELSIDVPRMAYAFIDLTADQTTNLTANNHIQFNNIVAQRGSISVSTGAGQANGIITLEADKTYRLEANIHVIVDGGTDYGTFQWRNNTTSTLIGKIATCTNNDVNTDRPDQPTAIAVITTTAPTNVELRVIASSSLNGIESTGTSVMIQEI
jgi:hypothetical protein